MIFGIITWVFEQGKQTYNYCSKFYVYQCQEYYKLPSTHLATLNKSPKRIINRNRKELQNDKNHQYQKFISNINDIQ